jgi:hypothetical protein
MKRVLSNLKRISVKYPFRGREIFFRYKQKRIFDMDDEEEAAEYYLWKDRYDWIIDITANCPDVNKEVKDL